MSTTKTNGEKGKVYLQAGVLTEKSEAVLMLYGQDGFIIKEFGDTCCKRLLVKICHSPICVQHRIGKFGADCPNTECRKRRSGMWLLSHAHNSMTRNPRFLQIE